MMAVRVESNVSDTACSHPDGYAVLGQIRQQGVGSVALGCRCGSQPPVDDGNPRVESNVSDIACSHPEGYAVLGQSRRQGAGSAV